MSCFALLKTIVNSICSGISHSSVSSVVSDVQAALSAGASMCVFSFSEFDLVSTTAFVAPLASKLGSRFSVESPFSEAEDDQNVS